MEIKDIKLDKKTIFYALFVIVVFALITRLLAGYTYYSRFDLSYYIRWASGLHEGGFFYAYDYLKDGANHLDYPPLFLLPLYFVGFFSSNPDIVASNHDFMLLFKVFQILFDVAIVVLIYFVFKKYGEVKALLGAAFWAMNPAMIINCAYWGQTDSLMIMLLLITFYFIQNDRIYWGTFFYCLSCLAKFQCAYFAPIFLLYIFAHEKFPQKFRLRNLKQLFIAIVIGATTVLTAFTPFMINSSDGILLPFKLYFGGFGKYQYTTYNAYNFYAAIGLNSKPEYDVAIGNISLGEISTFILVAIVLLIVVLYFKAPNKNPWILSFVLMQSIFMLTTRMHERYQIPVLIFCLAAYFVYNNIRFLQVFFVQSVLIFINEALVFFWWTLPDKADAWFYKNFNTLTIIFSVINLLFFGYTMYLSFKTMFQKEGKLNVKNV